MSELLGVACTLLSHHGAIVERTDTTRAEVLLPPLIQTFLGLKELVTFSSESDEQAISLSLGSDWIERLEGLLGTEGRYAEVELLAESFPFAPKNPAEMVAKHIAFQNASMRLAKVEDASTLYTIAVIHASLRSRDTRHELLVAARNESTSLLHPQLSGRLQGLLDGTIPGCRWLGASTTSVAEARVDLEVILKSHAPRELRRRCEDVILHSEARLQRDLERLDDYHRSLTSEVARRFAQARIDRSVADAKQAAIDRDLQFKCNELVRTSSIEISLTLEQVIRVRAPVKRLTLDVRRRKKQRSLVLDYNPLTRHLDTLICEQCGAAQQAWFCEDETVRLLCRGCNSGEHNFGAARACN